MTDTVTVQVTERNDSQENDGLGKAYLHRVPQEGEFIRYDDSKYRVHHVIHDSVSGSVEAIVS